MSQFGLAFGQTEGSIAGTPWAGSRGVVETVGTIQARTNRNPIRPLVVKTQEKEGPRRQGLRQNPLSPATAQWPLPTQAAPIPSARALAERSGPKFTISPGFLAASFTDPGISFVPPDTMGDVSPTQILMAINGRVRLFDRNGNLGSLNVQLEDFFESVRGGTLTSDPRVRWDRHTQRWYVIAINTAPSNNRVLLAVSNGPTITATSSFTFFQFQHNVPSPAGDDGEFFDYPTLGIDRNALYIGGNLFAGNSYTGTSAFVVRKSSLQGGGPAVVTAFRNLVNGSSSVGMFTPQGVDNDDPNATTGYFVGVDNSEFGRLIVRRVTDPAGSPSLSGNLFITVPTTANPTNVLAFGSSAPLDALDDRLYVAKIHTNKYTGAQTLWTSHNIDVTSSGVGSTSTGRVGSRWYEIQNLNATPSLRQSGTVFDGSTNSPRSYWIPAIAMNGQGHAAVGMSFASAQVAPGVASAFRFGTDALGTIRAPQTVVAANGTYNQESGVQRWGDYSHTVVDSADGQTLWSFQMYVDAANSYGIRIFSLKAPPPPAISNVTPNNVVVGNTTVVTVDANANAGEGFFDGGETFPNRLRASVSGTGVTVNSVNVVSPTRVTVSLTAAAGALTGGRVLTITNPDGQSRTVAISVGTRSITGGAILERFRGNVTTVPVTIQVRTPGTTNVVQTGTVNLATSGFAGVGSFTLPTTIANGTYDVAIKGPRFLQRVVRNVNVGTGGANNVTVSLTPGDVDGDNRITRADQNIAQGLTGTTTASPNWNPSADVDGNGRVDVSDVTLIRRSLGRRGDA